MGNDNDSMEFVAPPLRRNSGDLQRTTEAPEIHRGFSIIPRAEAAPVPQELTLLDPSEKLAQERNRLRADRVAQLEEAIELTPISTDFFGHFQDRRQQDDRLKLLAGQYLELPSTTDAHKAFEFVQAHGIGAFEDPTLKTRLEGLVKGDDTLNTVLSQMHEDAKNFSSNTLAGKVDEKLKYFAENALEAPYGETTREALLLLKENGRKALTDPAVNTRLFELQNSDDEARRITTSIIDAAREASYNIPGTGRTQEQVVAHTIAAREAAVAILGGQLNAAESYQRGENDNPCRIEDLGDFTAPAITCPEGTQLPRVASRGGKE